MSSVGYPDFFKPRDWLAGLSTEQNLFSSGIAFGGPSTLYTIPAGKVLVLTRLLLQLSVIANAAGTGPSFTEDVTVSRGIDGVSAATSLQKMVLITALGGYANDSYDLPHPVQITAPPGNTNLIQLTGTMNNMLNWGGVVLGYGALLN